MSPVCLIYKTHHPNRCYSVNIKHVDILILCNAPSDFFFTWKFHPNSRSSLTYSSCSKMNVAFRKYTATKQPWAKQTFASLWIVFPTKPIVNTNQNMRKMSLIFDRQAVKVFRHLRWILNVVWCCWMLCTKFLIRNSNLC